MSKPSRKSISTIDGPLSVLVHDAHRFDPDAFYAAHRGGSGNVILVIAYSDDGERVAIFGSIETAQKWAFSLSDEWHCVFAPYVVDQPGFGNETKN